MAPRVRLGPRGHPRIRDHSWHFRRATSSTSAWSRLWVPMPRILSVATALPPHLLTQTYARTEMARLAQGQPVERLVPVFDRAGVESRYLVRPPDWYLTPRTFEERNREYVARG